MATIVGRKRRILVNVRFFDKNGIPVHYCTSKIKKRIIRIVQLYSDKYGIVSGTCRVTYNKKEKYWNEFNFTDIETFLNILDIDTESKLVKEYM